jgi:hypothetical protein
LSDLRNSDYKLWQERERIKIEAIKRAFTANDKKPVKEEGSLRR